MCIYFVGKIPPTPNATLRAYGQLLGKIPNLQHFGSISQRGVAFFFACGNNSRISILFELQSKSKGSLMSTQTGNVSFVTTTDSTLRAADKESFVEFASNRIKAAPTVADTSVSRQTGLAGIWKNSFDPTSLTLHPNSGLTSTMKNNTLVVRPRSLRHSLPLSSPRITLFISTTPRPS